MAQSRKMFEIWRHYEYIGSFTFGEARQWLLNHLDPYFHDDLRRARRGVCKSAKCLRSIAAESEYCALNYIRPRVTAMSQRDEFAQLMAWASQRMRR